MAPEPGGTSPCASPSPSSHHLYRVTASSSSCNTFGAKCCSLMLLPPPPCRCSAHLNAIYSRDVCSEMLIIVTSLLSATLPQLAVAQVLHRASQQPLREE